MEELFHHFRYLSLLSLLSLLTTHLAPPISSSHRSSPRKPRAQGCTHHTVKVYLNGKRLPVTSFSSYIDLFLGPKLGGVPRVSTSIQHAQ